MRKHDVDRQKQIGFQILRAARELIAGRLGVIAASRELSCLRHEVEPHIASVLLNFTGIDSETDALPIGGIRKEWNPEALVRKDKEIAEAEQFYREKAINAATELIRLLENPS